MILGKHHPPGLSVLFFTEMWERFSYYGMRALLVLYLVNAIDYPREKALALYATYTGLVYLSPLIGGYIADKWLGTRRAVAIGAIVMALGHFAMAFPSLLIIGLGLLITGNGFFKPNISSTVGALYADGDARRDAGFTIFYMGINLGAFFSPLVCGTLGEKVGWHWGFAAAGIGMVVGLLIFVYGQERLGYAGLPKGREASGQTRLNKNDWRLILFISFCCLCAVVLAVNAWPWIELIWVKLNLAWQTMLVLILVSLLVSLPKLVDRTKALVMGLPASNQPKVSLTKQEIHRIIAIIIMALFVVFFWMGFEQAGGTMNLFADKLTDRNLFGWEVPATYFQSINPLVIILLAPVFSLMWVRLDRSRFALSPIVKQALGMIILGCGFVVLAIAQERADVLGKVGPIWLVAVYVLHTLGELCLSPIGLSMVSKLAPSQLISILMGLWFTAMALANYLAGTLEEILSGSAIPLYWFLVASSIGAGILLLLISPLLHRLMHGVR